MRPSPNDAVEFGAIVADEEDVVSREREADGPADDAPRHVPTASDRPGEAGDRGPLATGRAGRCAERRHVAVEHDRVGVDRRAPRLRAVGSDLDADRAPVADDDLVDAALNSIVPPSRRSRPASASASRCMPPSTRHTPCCSTCATSISVAGAANGDEPQ